MNTILFATDGSPSAGKALDAAVETAKDMGSPLLVLAVWHAPLLTAYGYTPAVFVPELVDAERGHALDVARAAAGIAEDAGVSATYEIREGDAATEICDLAARKQVRMIVMGAHGWGALKRLFVGSVSTRVLHDAPCPVLVVRMNEHELLEQAREREKAAAA